MRVCVHVHEMFIFVCVFVCMFVCVCMCACFRMCVRVCLCQNEKRVPDYWQTRQAKIANHSFYILQGLLSSPRIRLSLVKKRERPRRKQSAVKWESWDLVRQAKEVWEEVYAGREFNREAAEGIKDWRWSWAVEEHREGLTELGLHMK